MRKRRLLEIHTDPDKRLIFSPMVVARYSLEGLRRVSKEAEQTIPGNSASDVFWRVFDETLLRAPKSE